MKNKIKNKRFFGFLLAVIMTISIMPLSAIAYADETANEQYAVQIAEDSPQPSSLEEGGETAESSDAPVPEASELPASVGEENEGKTENIPEWTISLKADQDSLRLTGESLPDFSFRLHAELQASAKQTKDTKVRNYIEANLMLPEGMHLSGEFFVLDNQIMADKASVLRIEGLGKDAEIQIKDRAGDQHLSFAIDCPAVQEISDLQYEFIFSGAAFSCTEDIQLSDDAVVLLEISMATFTGQDNIQKTESVKEYLPILAELPGEQFQEKISNITDMGAVAAVPAAIEEQVRIDAYRDAYSQNIFWIDHNNEEKLRPGGEEYPRPKLNFSIDGNTFEELTESNMETLGMEEFPQIDIDTQRGAGNYMLSIGRNTLPSQITYIDSYGDEAAHKVVWKIEPQDVNGYSTVEITDENIGENPSASVTGIGWYYVLTSEFKSDFRIRWGTLGSAPGITNAIKDYFKLVVETNREKQEYQLSKLPAESVVFTVDPSADPNNPTSGTLIIQNIWKYNLDGSSIFCTMEKNDSDAGGITLPVLPQEDYFAVAYDNSAAPNFGSVTDKAHNGGRIYLTLTGKTDYDAYKIWLDEGGEFIAQRPTGEFQLWRYRRGKSYTTAAPIRNTDGTIKTITLNTGEDSQLISFDDLEKYDSEGFEYIYVIREYLDSKTAEGAAANSYEQVFGTVAEDGSIGDHIDQNGEIVEAGERPSGNTFLYDGGTLSNRIVGTISVPVSKTWKAAAFQSGFEDVRIQLTLESRIAGSTGEWKTTSASQEIDGFFAENLTVTMQQSMPEYDALGRKLEYRWIETAVYQGEGSTDNLLVPDETGGVFTLQQDGRQIDYRSSSVVQTDGSTLVTNSIANTIDYETTKIWMNGEGEPTEAPAGESATFHIYRSIGGEQIGDPVAVFTMDGTADETPVLVNEELGIYAQETEPWISEVTALAEYDAEGRQYEYILLEAGTRGTYIPNYETQRNEEGYQTTVYNAPGVGNYIMVRKIWTDDSDNAHRLPVTVAIYSRVDKYGYQSNQKITEVTLGNGVWYKIAGIGRLQPEEVYILETAVGDTPVPFTTYYLNGEAEPNYSEPQAPVEYRGNNDDYTAIQYETQYHRYDATYSREKIAGELCYTVINRRLGNIDLTVTKNWVDGAGENRQKIQNELERLFAEEGVALFPALRLDFAEGTAQSYYRITRNGLDSTDAVTIGNQDDMVAVKNSAGQPESSVQRLDISVPESEYTFFNLPKYDRNGSVVQYDVHEIWVDESGNAISMERIQKKYPALYSLLTEYETSYKQTEYTVGELHAADSQTIAVTNRLQGTKDVLWHKQWEDDYNYQSNYRPDIYLDIYQTSHISADKLETVLYRANYKWTYSSLDPGSDPDGLYDKQNHWHAEITRLPKYDALGYEIMYYASEHTAVNSQDFDYLPVEYSIPNGDEGLATIRIGTEYDVEAEYQGEEYVQNIGSLIGSEEPYYALIEEGTFTNTIAAPVTVQGQKRWNNLSAGFPAEDLPAVTFSLDRQYTDRNGAIQKTEGIATLTITDWASFYNNGSYIFQMEYMGKNSMSTGPDGKIVVSGESSDAQRLPKYTEDGRMYTYILRETSVTWPNGSAPDSTLVFGTPTINNYIVTNFYDSIQGALKVKKLMELPVGADGKPEAYPAVRFELSRTYTVYDANGNPKGESVPEVVERQIWSSEEMREVYEASRNITVEKEFTFEGLDIYAPNGSQYSYAVTEIKTYLGDYETWAVSGSITADEAQTVKKDENKRESVSALALTMNQDGGRGETAENVAVAATFINAPVKDGRETVTLTGTKVWDDFGNAFQLRPEEINITVSRYANQQPGQGNGIGESVLPEEQYEIVWDKGSDGNKWTYAIGGKAGTGELERYAPNGMPWEYVVTETAHQGSENVYTVSPANGRVTEQSQQETEITMYDLRNTIATSVPYSKTWIDADGAAITEDYLGIELTVSFKLQVAERTDGNTGAWQDAEEYFSNHLDDAVYRAIFADYAFEQKKTGRINDSTVWGTEGQFSGLPYLIRENGASDETIRLAYRIIETEISYGSTTQTVTVHDVNETGYTYEFTAGLFSPAYKNPQGEWAASNLNTTRNIYNRMETTELVAKKIWSGDNDNIYATRPETERKKYDWEVSFTIQRSANEGKTWENVAVYGADGTREDLVVTVYGTNQEASAQAIASGLPKTAEAGGAAYLYRARELQPGYTVSAGQVSNEDIIGDGALYYDAYTTTYPNGTTAQNTLNQTAVYVSKVWNPSTTPAPVTMELQYKGADGRWRSFENRALVVLDGTADTPGKVYYEYESWKGIWNGVPEVIRGSALTQDGKTQYRVVETLPSGYVQESGTVQTREDGAIEYHYTNVAETSFGVEKKWSGVSAVQQGNVVVGLWRTTGDKEEAVPVEDENGTQLKRTLTAVGSWKASFEGLPRYSESGAAYTYFARELTIGGKPAKDAGFFIYHEDTESKTVIANIGKRDISGTKTWRDNQNAYGTRPEELTLTLYRSISGGTEETVDAEPVWEKNGDIWKYSYTGLPVTDHAGNTYTYRVEEAVPGEYAGKQEDFALTNTLEDEIDIPVTKVWKDGGNADGLRPDSITVALYADGVEVRRETVTAGNIIQEFWKALTGQGDIWSYTFTGLPEYDASGKRITYTVKEFDIPPEYRSETDGFTIINTLQVELPVLKVWGGVPEDEQGEIAVGLYRKTNEAEEAEKVCDEQGAHMTLKLHEDNQWQDVFRELPRFDEEGNRHLYFAQELAVGEKPIEETEYIVHSTTDDHGTSIANIAATEVSGVKRWKDNSNAYGTRPEELTLTLYRSISGGEDEKVDEEPIWDKRGDTWLYRYTGLPMTDDAGNPYTYHVEEAVPEGYVGEQDGQNFTNILSKVIDIPVVKIWNDNGNAFGTRPETIRIILYANGTEAASAEIGIGKEGVRQKNMGDSWEYSFTGLPQYDENGVEIVYTIAEADVPDGYDAYYHGFTVENVQKGNLSVSKSVTGNGGEQDRDFHFTVRTDDVSIDGIYGDMVFQSGTARLTLKHGETVTALGLPAGTGYTVIEDEAEGYRVTAQGNEGTIMPGDTVKAIFENYRTPPAEQTEDGENPKTGETNEMFCYMILLLTALPVLTVCIFVKQKRRHTK